MSPGSMERMVEVEISKDKSSFMAWLRIPIGSDALSSFLKFLNTVGGSGVVSTKEERGLIKDMRDICYEQQVAKANEIEIAVRKAMNHTL